MKKFKDFIKNGNIDVSDFKEAVVCTASFAPIHKGYVPLIEQILKITNETNIYDIIIASIQNKQTNGLNLNPGDIIESILINIPQVDQIIFSSDYINLGDKLVENKIYPKIAITSNIDSAKFIISIENSFGKYYADRLDVRSIRSKINENYLSIKNVTTDLVVLESVIENNYGHFKSLLINENDDEALAMFMKLRKKYTNGG